MNSDKIAKVANQVVAHWQNTREHRLEVFHVVCDGPTTDCFDEFKSRPFSVGIGEELTQVSFDDLLLIYWYLARYISNPDQAERANQMVVQISSNDAPSLLQQIINTCRFEFQES